VCVIVCVCVLFWPAFVRTHCTSEPYLSQLAFRNCFVQRLHRLSVCRQSSVGRMGCLHVCPAWNANRTGSTRKGGHGWKQESDLLDKFQEPHTSHSMHGHLLRSVDLHACPAEKRRVEVGVKPTHQTYLTLALCVQEAAHCNRNTSPECA
jgi:hypothetical protein